MLAGIKAAAEDMSLMGKYKCRQLILSEQRPSPEFIVSELYHLCKAA